MTISLGCYEDQMTQYMGSCFGNYKNLYNLFIQFINNKQERIQKGKQTRKIRRLELQYAGETDPQKGINVGF